MKLVRMGIVVSLVTMLLLIVLVSCVKIDTLHDEPGNPSPTDGAVGVSITPTLKWETKYKWPFEVYLSSDPKAVEKELESAQISSDSTENQCKINVPLEYNTKYYWKVVFKTFGVKMMESPVWSFTTGSPLSLEIPDQMVNEGDTLELNLLDFVSGATSGVLTFTKISGVGTVTGNTYIYSPDYEASGAYKVIIKAADSASEATDDFIITVKNVNRAPVLNIPDQTVSEGATLTLDLTEYANDDDGDTLSFELVEGTGTIVGTRYMYKANYDASGTYIVEIKVSDGMGGEATDTFTLVVFNVNRIPIWNISDVFNMLENTTLTLKLTDYASDPDGDSLTFRLVSGVGRVDGDTYTFTAGYDASGTYEVVLGASDGSTEATAGFTLVVANVNRLPTLSIPDQSVFENTTLTLDLTECATDPDGDVLTFTMVRGPGSIEGSVYTYTPDYDASGTYIVEIKVSDGMGGEATDTFTLVVFNVNRIPIWNISDVFNMLENTTLTLKLTDYASDPDGDSLTFRLVSGVGRVDGDTYTFTAGYDASGTYEVVLGASDGSAEATAGFRIEVGNVNRLPMIDLPDEWIINEITNLVLNLMEYASDPDGDVLSFELVEGTGTIIGTQYIFEPDYDSSGTYRIEIKVTDGMGGEATDVFTLKVLNVNRIPRIDVPDFDDLLEGLKFTIDLTDYATDDDGDELTFELLSEEGTIVGSIFIYEPDYDASGTHVVEVKVSDGMGGEATDVFTLKVWNVNRAPVWDQIAIQTINEGLTFTLDLSQYASDPDGDLLTFSLVSGVGSIDGSIYSFTAGYDAAGSYEIVVAASDDSAESTTSFWLEVFDVNQPPESVLLLNPLDKATGVPTTVTFMWQATDPDNDDLVYDLYLADNPDIFTLVAANISTSTFEKSGLSYETTYYWKVVAKDGKGGVATSTVYSFTTISQGNNAPSTPTALYPSDGATDVPTNVTLRWWATDPDGDPIVYDVYFGTNKDSLQKILSDTPSTSTEQSSLFYATTYYWKVVAKDGKGGIATSTIWSFTTKASPNSPPNQPVAISPEDGATDVPTKTTLSWACSDPDGDQLEYDLYFGTDQQSLALLASGLSVNTYSLSDLAYGTTYYWQVVARDGKGGAATSSVWSFTTASTPTQGLTTQWSVILGGTAYEQAMSIARVSDGYIVAGYTGSNDGDVSGNHGEEDFWVLKLSTDGTVTWDKLYGGSGSEMAWDVMLTADGGYVVVGYSTSSQDGDVMDSNNGQEDVWVIKLDSTGNILWQKLIGSSGSDVSMSVCEVCDTNTLSYYYVVAGYVEAGDGDVNAATHGGTDTWLVKLSATTGDIVAQAVLGGSGDEVAYSIKPTSDGGYIVVGSTTSDNSGDVGSNNGGTDFWVVKLDSDFNIQWSECYGGVYDDGALDVEVVSDGYIVTGFKSTSSGDRDAWVIKLDSNGTQVWDVVIAQSLDSADEARSICSTSDGNYLVAGVMGYDPDTSDSQGFIAKMDGSGNALWGHLFPSDQSDTTPYEIHDVIEDPGNGNIVVVGRIGDQLWVSALK